MNKYKETKTSKANKTDLGLPGHRSIESSVSYELSASATRSEGKKPGGARRRPDMPNPNALAFRVQEVRALGGPGPTKLYELIAAGRLKATKLGATRLIDGDSLRALLRGEA